MDGISLIEKKIINDWIWMPHPGHFSGAYDCQFRLCTFVNGFIISTIGEYHPDRPKHTLGTGDRDYYETMVFRAVKSKNDACGCEYRIDSGLELACKRYSTGKKAKNGHMDFCLKCDRGEIQNRSVPYNDVTNNTQGE